MQRERSFRVAEHEVEEYFRIFKMFLCRTEGRSHSASGGRGGGLRASFLWDKPEQRTSGSDKGTEEDIRAPRPSQ